MLWQYANIIVGNRDVYLNPVEGFILNSVFLLHDAGMCYSILNNKNEIENDKMYKDYIANSQKDIPKEELDLEALFYTVRQYHGEFAIRIASDLINDEEFFIPDANYRQEFGDIIGKIAKSHTCNINYIERELGQSYSSPRFPHEWSIDIKKISFLLRTADAADLDNLRAPKTLKMISEIKGDSKEHWTFQKKLGLPKLDSDGYLVYSTNSAFKKEEQKAWWYCYNALKQLDEELKNASNYFASKKQVVFNATGVKYIDDSLALGKNSLKTSGWDSINTTIRVSNPIHIASELGGEKLYGNKNIAVRELIQNSIDAIHVYRIFTGQSNLAVGKIYIGIEKIDADYFLVAGDNGIGMSQNLMTNELLDFGGSYWKSNKFLNDFKGLKSSGFESIGKFGIGFFSVFMLGEKVTVTSWKYGENIDSMRTLDFYDGLFSNPILRNPTEIEKNSVIDRGTLIKIKLSKNPYEKGGIVYDENLKDCSLKALVQYYVPSIDIEIVVKELDDRIYTFPPNNIYKLNCSQLYEYTNIKKSSLLDIFPDSKEISIENIKKLSLELIEIKEDDKILGKLTIMPRDKTVYLFREPGLGAVILANGIRVKEVQGYIGYINTNEVISIKRDNVKNIVSFDSMKNWAIEQIKQMERLKTIAYSEFYEKKIMDLTVAFGLFNEDFPLTKTKKNGEYKNVSIKEFREFAKQNTQVLFYQEKEASKKHNKNCDGFINTTYLNTFEAFVKDDENDKIYDSEKIITNILKDEWGDFKQSSSDLEDSESNNSPYSYIWTLRKKEEIQ